MKDSTYTLSIIEIHCNNCIWKCHKWMAKV